MRSIRTYMAVEDIVVLVACNGNEHTIRCPREKFLASVRAYDAGALVQDAFPYLDVTDREFLITGLTPAQQDEIFK